MLTGFAIFLIDCTTRTHDVQVLIISAFQFLLAFTTNASEAVLANTLLSAVGIMAMVIVRGTVGTIKNPFLLQSTTLLWFTVSMDTDEAFSANALLVTKLVMFANAVLLSSTRPALDL